MSTLALPTPLTARPPGRGHVTAAVLLLATVVTVLVVAFAWPAARSAPRDVPLGIAGPGAAAVERALPAGAFATRRYPDEAAARAAIRDREVYGAVVTGADGPVVLTASAAGAPVAQALGQLATGLGAATGTAVPVRDVVPAPAADPRGTGLAAGTLPLALAGILAAALLGRVVAGRWARLGGALAYAVVGGAAVAAVLRYWIGAVDGSYLAVAGVLALALAATTVTLLGLEAALGSPGLALGGAVLVALGNPLSGAAGAPELLPTGWGTLGQWLPPGAEVTLLRSVGFFAGAGGGPAAAVLLGWLAVGVVLVATPRPVRVAATA